MTEFALKTNFEDIIVEAIRLVQGSPRDYCINFSLKVSFPVDLVYSVQLPDVAGLAKAFQASVCPSNLYINHGSYITERGMAHVLKELNKKHKSNRAIISLISQKDILDSNDDPIPSFMVMQFSIEDYGELCVTTYFRALEVSSFLRINLEEIRLLCMQIVEQNKTLEIVKLHVFAFRAYENRYINTLIIPKIERMDPVELMKILEHSPVLMADLIREKAQFTTVLNNHDLLTVNRIVTDVSLEKVLHQRLVSMAFKKLLQRAISESENLRCLRQEASHFPRIKKAADHFQEALENLAKEFELCR